MIDSKQADAIMDELPHLKALLAAEREKGSVYVPNLAHRLNALTGALRAYREALANPAPKPVEPVAPKRSLRSHPMFAKDCSIPDCSICMSIGGKDRYSLPRHFFE